MKKMLFLFVFLSVSAAVFGAELNVKFRFGGDHLFTPREILIRGDEIFVLDEVAEMTAGVEKHPMRGPVFDFALTGDSLYAVDRDNAEILVYSLKKVKTEEDSGCCMRLTL